MHLIANVMGSDTQISFPCLNQFPWLVQGFTLRQPGIDVKAPKSESLARLRERHRSLLLEKGIDWSRMQYVDQVHGNQVVVSARATSSQAPADGLITNEVDLPIGIHVADCCAIYLVDRKRRGIALLHSGRKGTAANIAAEGVRQLGTNFAVEPQDIVAALSPCIHACCYEIDFVSQIESQLKAEGVREVWRHPDCTGCEINRYYSYRKEMGHTGRMLAFMMIKRSVSSS